MKEFFKSNVEKVVLIGIMAILVVVSIFVIVTVDVNPVDIVDPNGRDVVKTTVLEPSDLQRINVNRLNSVFDNGQYLICRNEECQKVFHDDFRKCPWCKTQVKIGGPTGPGVDDEDGDGLSNTLEAENNMDPNNPDDAQEDRDGDGFTNYDEIMVGINGVPTLIDDASSYPSLLNFILAKRKKARPIPFIYKSDQVASADKTKWEIQFLDTRRKTRWVRIGGAIFTSGYQLMDIVKTNNGLELTVQKEGESIVKVFKGKFAYPADSSGMLVLNNLDGKTAFVADGGKYEFIGKDGAKEVVDFRGWRRSGEEKVLKAVLFSRKTNEEFEIDGRKSILTPVK